MKKTFYLICLIVLQSSYAHLSLSQSKETYTFKNAIDLNECDFYGGIYKNDGSIWTSGDAENTKKAKVVIANTYLFKIIKMTDKGYVINILKWTEKDPVKFNFRDNEKEKERNEKNKVKNLLYSENEIIVGATTIRKEKYYFVSIDDFKNNAIEKVELPRWAFNTGVVSLPIKMRFGSPILKNSKGEEYRERYFNVTSDVNIGLSAGLKWRPRKKDEFAISLLGGVNLTSIQVDSSTTKGYIRSSINASSLTPTISLVFEFKDFQIGIFTGSDLLSKELGDKWAYNGKSWVGLGLGYNILGSSTKPSTATNNTTK